MMLARTQKVPQTSERGKSKALGRAVEGRLFASNLLKNT